ncbi:MAG TPA: MarR family transcriptional regulator [Solirubrobacteraceae bacterium]|nr:MarR family transcriptional regulator [Solirubrobacteraceae bacterium]
MSSRRLAFDPIAEARRQWDLHWRSEATPQMVAVTSIMRAQQILMQRLNALLEPHDLTFPRYETLMVLYYSRAGELPLGKLSDRLQVHRASVTNVIDKLEASGYVVRVAHERDRRTILARISDRGRDVAASATQTLNRAQFATAPLPTAACEQLFELLEPLRREAGDF